MAAAAILKVAATICNQSKTEAPDLTTCNLVTCSLTRSGTGM